MKGKLLLIGLLALAIALSGCIEPVAPETAYKYVCSDGTIVDKVGLCPTEEEIDLEIVCVDYCEETEPGLNTVEYIKSEMASSNYCQASGDCNVSDTKCPLGCYNLVNRTELGRINALVAGFKQTCFQTCMQLTEIACEEGKCTAVEVGTG